MSNKVFEEENYWFPAKRYGWGWGLPITWQGWMIFALYFVLLIAFGRVFPPAEKAELYAISVILLSSALVFVCWLKGEPPRWRWGGDDLC
ncbi:MAG: hypothetical protein OEM82_09260 [Acidobacteriota bacterium]|nr:hypothetical protein [Acidobacteriota bacterium]MDH3531223.1 hypothetical protein [Acidobacteriota bacterium]